jgi:hypothetical protein
MFAESIFGSSRLEKSYNRVMKNFSILVMGIALSACAPGVFNPANGIPMDANETWNLKIMDKTGAVSLNENFKLSGSARSYSQTQDLPPSSGSGLVEVRVTETYETGLLKFFISPVGSTQVAGIRSDKHTGIITYFASRDQRLRKIIQVFPDSYKTKADQDSCEFIDFQDLGNFQGNAVRYTDGNFGNVNTVGTCTFTKLEPAPK